MTTCDKIRPRLTAYLDGDLADEHGSVVRGHLRECAPCRDVARDEALLRDGLRGLAPVDPPATLWPGIQARLAAAEVADARRPRWRRQAARWTRWARWSPTVPQVAAAGLVGAAAVAMLTWRSHAGEPLQTARTTPAPVRYEVASLPPPAPVAAVLPAPSSHDVTEDLRAEPAQTTASYDRVIEELMKLAVEDNTRWSADARAAFDRRVAGLRDSIAHAGPPRSVQRAQRSMIRFLQGALVREDIVLASGGTR